MVWTKQAVGIAVGLSALSLLAGGTAGFILGLRHQARSAPSQAQAPAVQQEPTDTDDAEESPLVRTDGRRAGTRFLAAKTIVVPAEAEKKDAPVVAAGSTNSNAPAIPADTGGTSRRRSRRG